MVRDSRQKARILSAAAELFAEHGYHGTGMAQLEAAVGLQRGALYHHIGSKEALLYEISSSPLRLMIEIATAIAARVKDPEERIRELARAIMANVADHRLEWTVHYRDFNALTGERLQSVLEMRRDYEQIWWRALMDGITAGDFEPIQEAVALKGILGMFNYSYVWLDKSGPQKPHEIADIFCNTFLDGIRRVA
ncbi:TetR family transcriptional regulator [Jatrophihabitans sp. GAS493]|uniref:TetR/AcrR family transcriptional regulator n=1 Tax=Jatrophihabitans sp. GAS493 TaxID=1907575 RepID=UPI000BB7481C|nr:TetR/AcrR family transcriptional regulator [Jatrophihabitans sp. GAS493]SOD71822.1 TetR family transcriptional regulator [Jatrophihabitans sp. GAS493]